MENYDNFFNFNDQGRTPVYHTPDPVDPKDNKSGKKFTVITVLFVVIALIMCIAIVANVVVLASADRDIPADVIAQIEDNVIKELTTSAAVVAGTKTVFSTVQVIAVNKEERTASYGSGFLITATNTKGETARYVVTNAHVVLKTVRETNNIGGGIWGGGTITTSRRHDHYIVQIRGV